MTYITIHHQTALDPPPLSMMLDTFYFWRIGYFLLFNGKMEKERIRRKGRRKKEKGNEGKDGKSVKGRGKESWDKQRSIENIS